MKKTVLVCTQNNRFTSLIQSVCKVGAIEAILVKNGRELPELINSVSIIAILIDTSIQDPCAIDLLNLLYELNNEIPIIVIGNCEEKVLLSIKRIGTSKKLIVHAIHLDLFGKKEFLEIIDLIDKKSHIINNETITTALQKKQFKMYYQPKISINNNSLVGVEALIRWDRPNIGIVSPDSFISIAEESGLIIPMTYWVIHEVFSQYALWSKQKITTSIAINLSAKILTDIMLPDELDKLSKEFKVNPAHICFEITESAAMHWPEIVLEVVTRIRLKGFSLSIDDFGTGYSSLVELQQLPFTELKIDKSFITDLNQNQANLHIVRAIINLAQNMELSLVAEGVETSDALTRLKELGCDNLQGYLISKPLSVDEFIIWYKSKIDKNGTYKIRGDYDSH